LFYFTTPSVSQTTLGPMVRGWMNDWIEHERKLSHDGWINAHDLKGSWYDLTEVFSRHVWWVSGESRKASVRIVRLFCTKLSFEEWNYLVQVQPDTGLPANTLHYFVLGITNCRNKKLYTFLRNDKLQYLETIENGIYEPQSCSGSQVFPFSGLQIWYLYTRIISQVVYRNMKVINVQCVCMSCSVKAPGWCEISRSILMPYFTFQLTAADLPKKSIPVT
jgi:hypothetical protein